MFKKVVWPGVLVGVIMLAVGMAMNYFMNFVFPSLQVEYETSGVFRPWDDPLMSLYFLYPIAIGLVLAWVWDKTKALFKGSDSKRAINFALAYWILTSIPSVIINYSSFPISFLMIFSWLIIGLIYGLIAGFIFVKLNK